MVKNPPCNAADAASAPGQGTKIPHATEQLDPTQPNKYILKEKKKACIHYYKTIVKPESIVITMLEIFICISQNTPACLYI